MKLQAVEGKLSKYYNTFKDYDFTECVATDTRLMGVVALLVTWTGKSNKRDKFYQVIHLDYSEYGIDDYFEYECIPGREDYYEKKAKMQLKWDSFVNVMGGKIIPVCAEVLVGLYDSAKPLASDFIKRGYDDEENREFRTYAIRRMDTMCDELKQAGVLTAEYSEMDIIDLTSQQNLAACETINYFLMRLIDQDYMAASYLSTISITDLKKCPVTRQGIQTLIRNKIKMSEDASDVPSDGFSHPYRCSMTTLSDIGYYYCTLVIYLNADFRSKNAKISEIVVGSINRLSDYEAAVQIRNTEYITVFDCMDRVLNQFDGNKIKFLFGYEPQLVNNGWLYTIYNKDNSHVNKSNYWLNDDVYGYAILTIDGEFILMSNKMDNITYMDECTSMSYYAPYMRLDGRYQLDTPIFHTLCQQRGVMFRDLIEYGEPPR